MATRERRETEPTRQSPNWEPAVVDDPASRSPEERAREFDMREQVLSDRGRRGFWWALMLVLVAIGVAWVWWPWT